MPILQKEDDIFPSDLLENQDVLADLARSWYCLYTLSRREKDLMRRLKAAEISFYSPVVPKRYRSPSGRLRTSYVPLFPNYVFMFADETQRYFSLTTNCISRYEVIEDRDQLATDLANIQKAVSAGIPLTPEAKLEPGQLVRVRSGPFKGFEGHVLRREGKTRLLLSIRFLEQGVSMEMDEAVLTPI